MVCRLEHRGNHATGIALMVDGEVKIIKDKVPAWSFIAQKETVDFLEEFLPRASMALLHTRFATIGNPKDNNNNHPMFMGHSAVVHNGSIGNHAKIFEDYIKGPRSCETDSDVFRAAFDKEGLSKAAIEILNHAAGSAAIAAISQDTPDLLVLARSGSPLVYATTEDKLWWASELQAIQQAVRPWTHHHGLQARKTRPDVSYFTMPDNTAYILGPKGRTDRMPFDICVHYTQPAYNMRGTYQSKMASFGLDKKKTTTIPKEYTRKQLCCSKTGCGTMVNIPIADKWFKFSCPTCKTNLRALDAIPESEWTLLG